MDDELKGRLAKYLDALEKGAQKAGEFAEVEIPATVREWLVWYAVSHAVYALCFVAIAVTAYFVGRRLMPRMAAYLDEHRCWDEPPVVGFAALCILRWVAPGLFLIGFVVHGLEVAKAIIAPRVLIVEKVAELVRPEPAKK